MHIVKQSHSSFLIDACYVLTKEEVWWSKTCIYSCGCNAEFDKRCYRPNGGIHYQSVCICSAGRNQGGKHALAPPPKFSKTCFVVRYNKSQSFCSHRKYQLVASLLSGIHEHAMGTKQSVFYWKRTLGQGPYELICLTIQWFRGFTSVRKYDITFNEAQGRNQLIFFGGKIVTWCCS